MTLKLQQQKQVEMSHCEVQGHTVDRNFSINGVINWKWHKSRDLTVVIGNKTDYESFLWFDYEKGKYNSKVHQEDVFSRKREY